MGCAVSVVKDNFDNSVLIKIDENEGAFERINGNINFIRMMMSRELKDGVKNPPSKLFCKFEGYNGEKFDGDVIEVKVDKIIYKLKLTEARSGERTEQFATMTRIGNFTFADSTRTNVTIIAMETILDQNILNSMSNAKSITFRIMTKNIDGLSKNTFECLDYTIRAIKSFSNYKI